MIEGGHRLRHDLHHRGFVGEPGVEVVLLGGGERPDQQRLHHLGAGVGEDPMLVDLRRCGSGEQFGDQAPDGEQVGRLPEAARQVLQAQAGPGEVRPAGLLLGGRRQGGKERGDPEHRGQRPGERRRPWAPAHPSPSRRRLGARRPPRGVGARCWLGFRNGDHRWSSHLCRAPPWGARGLCPLRGRGLRPLRPGRRRVHHRGQGPLGHSRPQAGPPGGRLARRPSRGRGSRRQRALAGGGRRRRRGPSAHRRRPAPLRPGGVVRVGL